MKLWKLALFHLANAVFGAVAARHGRPRSAVLTIGAELSEYAVVGAGAIMESISVGVSCGLPLAPRGKAGRRAVVP